MSPKENSCNPSLFRQIWMHPAKTIAFILQNCPHRYIILLLALAGIATTLMNPVRFTLPEVFSGSGAVLTVLAGAVFGWIPIYIYAALLSKTGRWLNGKTTSDGFLTILAWAAVPLICSILVRLPQLVYPLTPGSPGLYTALQGLATFTQFFLVTWSLVILTRGVAVAQGFSAGLALLNIFLPLMLLAIFAGFLVLVFVT